MCAPAAGSARTTAERLQGRAESPLTGTEASPSAAESASPSAAQSGHAAEGRTASQVLDAKLARDETRMQAFEERDVAHIAPVQVRQL